MRRVLAGLLALLVLLAAYVTLDIFDVVPGVLTREAAPPAVQPATSAPSAPPSAALPLPSAQPSAQPLPALESTAPEPTAKALAGLVAKSLGDPALGPSVGVEVRDALTGAKLLTRGADKPRTPASTAKLLTALAVDTTLDPHTTMTTKVVRGAKPGQVVLVAGGDTMLAPGNGKPTAVEGRAGLADLARQVSAALQATGTTTVSLRLDTSYAAGPKYAPGWDPADVTAGYTQAVTMLGLAGERPRPSHPSPTDPEAAVAKAFVAALAKAGVTAKLTPRSTWAAAAVPGAAELGRVESAPVTDVLSLALDDSDNALTESLARQATVKAGGAATFAAAVAFVRRTDTALGVDLTHATLKDTCGLTSGQSVPVHVLSDVLQLGASADVPAMRATISKLPVAGLSGTLHDRFVKSGHAAAGIVRAKTGTLTGISAMAGTVTDADGRVLTFVIAADRVRPGVGTLLARTALDRFVATLASCGCR